MEDLKKWMKNNWSTVIFAVLLVVLLVNPDAKAWLMRQMASTGILNSSISESTTSQIPSIDFMVKNEDGTTINTADLKGKVVFINFWASWCPPCRAEFPSIQEFYEKYRNHQDIVFLTVNLDDNPGLGKAYLKQKNFTVPFIIPAGAIPKELYSGSLPTTVVLDKKGRIRLHHQGLADYSKDSFYTQVDELVNGKL